MKKIVLAILVCASVIAMAGYSQACCIYNNSSHPLKVEWSLFNIWTIAPSNKQCTNGTGGSVHIKLMDGLRQNQISDTKQMDVDDHGWLSVYKKENNRWKIVSKHKDGSIKSIKYLEPID